MKIDYTLYLCTDRELMTSKTVEESAEQAILGGATVIQLREKNCTGREFYDTAVRVKAVTDKYGVPLIINDRADIAIATGCAGIHLGQSDIPCEAFRKKFPDMLIGVSCATVEEAVKAERDGADYLGVGAMFATNTKTDTRPVSREELAKIREAVKIPIVIIGGINASTLGQFKGMGIDGIAVVSAIVAQPDIKAAAEKIKALWTE